MPYAVIVINPNRRSLLDAADFCLVRSEFKELAQRLRGGRVILYQSGRSAAGPGYTPGYFATAYVVSVYDHGEDAKLSIVRLSDVSIWPQAQPLRTDSTCQEPDLLDAQGQFKGWQAAQDIRTISTVDLDRIAGGTDWRQDPTLQTPIEEPNQAEPAFRVRNERVRDPMFAKLIYRAYRGRCAISGVMLLSPCGRFHGLEAAHTYPFALEARYTVNSGLLLAPTWHDRYDSGAIILNDDFSWSAVVEDTDTLAIGERRLLLPDSERDWPDVHLIRRNRERLAMA